MQRAIHAFTRTICLVFLFCIAISSWAQIGTDFWVAPPDVTDLNNPPGGEPIYLYVQSQSAIDATVTIQQPANGGFTPIIFTVFAGKTVRTNLTAFKNSLETRPTNTINNTGLRISSTQPVSAQYVIANTNNTDMLMLKGDNAPGLLFYIPLHKHAPFINNTFSAPHQAFASFDIVATQNGTTVTIYSPVAVDGHPANQQFSISLNAGQTYSCGFTGVGGCSGSYENPSTHPAGCVVISDKPVAVSIKDDSDHNPSGACTDLLADQLVPVNKLGTEYIAVKGSLNNTGDESLIIMATENNTAIYKDGVATPLTILFAGEYYRLDLDYLNAGPDNSTYINASKPIYAMHISGFGCEMGEALLPPVNYRANTINFSRGDAQTFYLEIICKNTEINNFTITGPGSAAINPASFLTVPGTAGIWMAARIQFNTTEVPVDSTFTLQNSSGSFLAAILNGGSTTGAKFGYLTPFAVNTTLPLRLLNLSGRNESDGNHLAWMAGEDGASYQYELQVLSDNMSWTTLHSLASGNVAGDRSYSYVHSNPKTGESSYRVVSKELSDNRILYSNVVQISAQRQVSLFLYPIPASDKLMIRLSVADGPVTATLYNVAGQMLRQQVSPNSFFMMDMKTLPPAIYVLKVRNRNGEWEKKITKQ
jgi:hypothetical protein